MHVNTFTRPSDKQIEAAQGNIDNAMCRMLDWHTYFRHSDGYRVALGDFAAVPGESWQHRFTALCRNLPSDTRLNGGEVGASTVRRAVSTSECVELGGIDLLRYVSGELLLSCMEASPRNLGSNKDAARAALAAERQHAPTGYLAVADYRRVNATTAEFDITQVGDVFVALDTGGRIPHVLQGSLEQRAYAGEVILGEDKKIDLLKSELKEHASAMYPDVSDQFFYDLVYSGTYRPQHTPKHIHDVEAFKAMVTAQLRQYACKKYAAQGLTAAIFDDMIRNGMTPWQQNVAQNNADAGPFWYPALDPIGDTPEHGIQHVRFRLEHLFDGNPARLTLWTDGSVPQASTGITLANLQGLNAYGEQTRLEIEIR